MILQIYSVRRKIRVVQFQSSVSSFATSRKLLCSHLSGHLDDIKFETDARLGLVSTLLIRIKFSEIWNLRITSTTICWYLDNSTTRPGYYYIRLSIYEWRFVPGHICMCSCIKRDHIKLVRQICFMNRDIKYHDLDNISFKNWVFEITSIFELKVSRHWSWWHFPIELMKKSNYFFVLDSRP